MSEHAYKLRFPRNGEEVVFQNGSEILKGICNGEPFAGGKDEKVLTHLPVHVPSTNANIMVDVLNIIEWPDD